MRNIADIEKSRAILLAVRATVEFKGPLADDAKLAVLLALSVLNWILDQDDNSGFQDFIDFHEAKLAEEHLAIVEVEIAPGQPPLPPQN